MTFYLKKIHSIRFKLMVSLFAVSLFTGLLSLLVGGNLLYKSVLDEVNHRIRQDLNVARVIYDDRIESIRLALEITSSAPDFAARVASLGSQGAARDVKDLFGRLELDFFGITDAQGHLACGFGEPARPVTESTLNPMVRQVMETSHPVAGTMVMDRTQLMAENPMLADRAKIEIQAANKNQTGSLTPETKGLVIGAALPILMEDCFVGVIYGGFLLNKDKTIVDKIGETVFENERYNGKNIGTATLFLNNLRIATNVKDPQGKRALGTSASPDVARKVLGLGEHWTDRAMVLDNWYLTAYEPIKDISGNRVGMFYVGVLEAKYWDVKKKAIGVFTVITLLGIAIALVLGWLFTGRIMQPVSQLIRASTQISSGNFSPDIGPVSKDDIGLLQEKFLTMTLALKEREQRQKAESEIQLIQSQKQASIGRLAAGVAHEINNPLTAVLTFTHLILKRNDLSEEVRSDLDVVASQTERVRTIVKSLLDFSRQTALTPEQTNINRLIDDCVRLMENQALVKGICLSFSAGVSIPDFKLDRSQIQSVVVNMIINALDATPSGGKIEICTTKTDSGTGANIMVTDTGCGISPRHMDILFDPFFTTKEIGKGTGLGLAVSEGIIQRHGGTISVQSEPGTGTTFTIYLPFYPDEPVPGDNSMEGLA